MRLWCICWSLRTIEISLESRNILKCSEYSIGTEWMGISHETARDKRLCQILLLHTPNLQWSRISNLLDRHFLSLPYSSLYLPYLPGRNWGNTSDSQCILRILCPWRVHQVRPIQYVPGTLSMQSEYLKSITVFQSTVIYRTSVIGDIFSLSASSISAMRRTILGKRTELRILSRISIEYGNRLW